MKLFFVLLLFALIAAGYYVYQRLLRIEREIRADQRGLADEQEAEVVPVNEEPEPPVVLPPDIPSEAGMVERILQLVGARPGLAQTTLYAEFADGERRELQKRLRELDQQGRLRREKKGNSYLLYPV